ncbi:DNA-directed DNA polymerase II small subunit [Methanobacterium oryzae]|uniref:DNA-directed DNA polymerase II small subunit n=1 Tax=Methanobacterium oryzae TaxID=69540 RepID=UPI003D1BEE26
MSDDIILKFTNANILVNDKAYERIISHENSQKFTDSLIEEILYSNNDVFILTEEILDQFLKTEDITDKEIDQKIEDDVGSDPVKSTPSQIKFNSGRPFDFHVIQDTSKKSYTSGEIKDFSTYFTSRFQKLKGFLDKRRELKDHRPINKIRQSEDVIHIIGMVNDIINTKNNHKIIELEDETGSINVLIHNENHKLFEESERIVRDEVIGIIGSKKGNFVIASEIVHPGVPRIDEKPMDFSAVFISDVHIGSATFLDDVFDKFIKWINVDFGDEEHRKIAENVKYLVVAGDLVDGIGIYPHQEKELTIKDIYKQYEEAARLFGQIREDIKIIISPGNHDACRLAEPQPAISEKYAESLYKLKNVEFVSNPGIVSLDGINVLMYHGRSFDDIAMTIKGLSHQQSDLIMKELLEKRHLAPIYGERTPLASEYEDHLVIDEIPDIFHTGHVHINSYKKHKGVHMINSGTFQSQTEFQKIYNIMPTYGQVPVIHKGAYRLLKFA